MLAFRTAPSCSSGTSVRGAYVNVNRVCYKHRIYQTISLSSVSQCQSSKQRCAVCRGPLSTVGISTSMPFAIGVGHTRRVLYHLFLGAHPHLNDKPGVRDFYARCVIQCQWFLLQASNIPDRFSVICSLIPALKAAPSRSSGVSVRGVYFNLNGIYYRCRTHRTTSLSILH